LLHDALSPIAGKVQALAEPWKFKPQAHLVLWVKLCANFGKVLTASSAGMHCTQGLSCESQKGKTQMSRSSHRRYRAANRPLVKPEDLGRALFAVAFVVGLLYSLVR